MYKSRKILKSSLSPENIEEILNRTRIKHPFQHTRECVHRWIITSALDKKYIYPFSWITTFMFDKETMLTFTRRPEMKHGRQDLAGCIHCCSLIKPAEHPLSSFLLSPPALNFAAVSFCSPSFPFLNLFFIFST